MVWMHHDMYMYFEKASGCQFFNGSSLARKSLKSCKDVAVVLPFFLKKLLLII